MKRKIVLEIFLRSTSFTTNSRRSSRTGCALLGVALFAWIPERMELWLGGTQPGTTGRIVAAFAIFLNIHHYLVDGTLSRLSETRNRQRLGID